ncbi:MAG: hypothetical protein HYU64_18670 [Armatimonadetes bacterium]|nr:hypothetical protein [Armatimonadota bacterium]
MIGEISSKGEEAQAALTEILENMRDTYTEIEATSQAMEVMTTRNEEVVLAIGNMARISQNNASMCQEMAANSHTVSKTLKETSGLSYEFSDISEKIKEGAKSQLRHLEAVTENVRLLSSHARNLEELVSTFKLEDGDGKAPEGPLLPVLSQGGRRNPFS